MKDIAYKRLIEVTQDFWKLKLLCPYNNWKDVFLFKIVHLNNFTSKKHMLEGLDYDAKSNSSLGTIMAREYNEFNIQSKCKKLL